jgi:ABC-type transporter lipoprotein component MlaA
VAEVDEHDIRFGQQVLDEINVYAQGDWKRIGTALCIVIQLGIRRMVPMLGPTKTREVVGQFLDEAEKEFQQNQN